MNLIKEERNTSFKLSATNRSQERQIISTLTQATATHAVFHTCPKAGKGNIKGLKSSLRAVLTQQMKNNRLKTSHSYEDCRIYNH